MTSLLSFLALTWISVTSSAYAASCCGASSTYPSIISGNDLLQLSTSLSQSYVVADAVGDKFQDRSSSDDETQQSLKVSAAARFGERWQAGLSIPFVRRARSIANRDADSAGLGDISMDISYEVLPDWSYSAWRPQAFVYAGITLATGGSRFNPSQVWALDARGTGFPSLQVGSLLLKTWGAFDVAAHGEIKRPFSKSYDDPSTGLANRYSPGWGVSGSISGGYSPARGPVRIGLAVSPSYNEGIDVSGAANFRTQDLLVWNFSAQLSYLVNSEVSLSAVYSDDLLLGEAANTALSRGISVVFQKRWPL